jgi:S-adenosyl-L-methionine hydrolase (adenosine-forming)
MPRITLLTDFGSSGGYAAAMKGMIASIAAHVRVDDAAHDIRSGDIAGAAIALWRYWDLYPPRTVHVVVVDPGVGSDRRGLAVEADDRFLVGPDNGVFTHVLRTADSVRAVSLTAREYFAPSVSATFHGRDVFAPVAAHLANGVPLEGFGPPVDDPVRLEWSEPRHSGGEIRGEVVHADHYGNLVSNIPGELCTPDSLVRVGERTIGRVKRTYADVDRGELVALVGSVGLLEVSVRDGSAADYLAAGVGAPVTVGV